MESVLSVQKEVFCCELNISKAPSFQHSTPLNYMNQKLTSQVKSSYFKRKGRNISAYNDQTVLANNKKILEVSLTCLFFKKFNKGVVFLAGE